MAGSLPSGAPADLYATLTREIRLRLAEDVLVAVDTSDEPLVKLGDQLESAAPDILKPNAFELAQLVGADGHVLETSASAGDYSEVVQAAQRLIQRGAKEILVRRLCLGSNAPTDCCEIYRWSRRQLTCWICYGSHSTPAVGPVPPNRGRLWLCCSRPTRYRDSKP